MVINNSIFSSKGKCGKKIIPNTELYVCQYHYNILLNAPPNPKHSFSQSYVCMICGYQDKETNSEQSFPYPKQVFSSEMVNTVI